MITGTIYLVGASLVWGVVHSFLASHGVKDGLRRVFGSVAFDKLYRFSYNLFSVASFFPIAMLLLVLPDRPLYHIPEPWVYLTTVVQGVGLVILIAGVMQTGPFEFLGLQQLTSLGGSQPPALVTDGLYAHIRHPLYTGGLLLMWLLPDVTLNRLALMITLTIYLIVGAFFEERKLQKEFGAAYSEYKARVPMFIPKIIHRQP